VLWKGKQKDDTDKRSFLKLSIANKVIDAINLVRLYMKGEFELVPVKLKSSMLRYYNAYLYLKVLVALCIE
jgi:hypothetical protein